MIGPWYDPNAEGLCVWGAWQASGATSLANSLIDRSGNGNDLAVGVAPGWDPTDGWDFDGLTQYLITSFVPQDDQSQSVLIQFTDLQGNGWIFGMVESGNSFEIHPDAEGVVEYGNGGGLRQGIPELSAGNLAIAGNVGYRDGIVDATGLSIWSIVPTVACYIGAVQYSGAPYAFAKVKVQAIVVYDCVLTADQVAAVVERMRVLGLLDVTLTDARVTTVAIRDALAGSVTLNNVRAHRVTLRDARDNTVTLCNVRVGQVAVTDGQAGTVTLRDARVGRVTISEALAGTVTLCNVRAERANGVDAEADGVTVEDTLAGSVTIQDAVLD